MRSTDPWVQVLLADGRSRSLTFDHLLASLDGTDAIVYVQRGLCSFGHMNACLPLTIAVRNGVRYLRVVIDPAKASLPHVALLGHELQHAFEIASAPDVRSSADMSALFRRIGQSSFCPAAVRGCYETEAAVTIGERIARELVRR